MTLKPSLYNNISAIIVGIIVTIICFWRVKNSNKKVTRNGSSHSLCRLPDDEKVTSKGSNHSLYRLPDGFLLIIMTKYLDIEDWSKLDVALCTHHKVREDFLDSLRSEQIQLLIDNNNTEWHTRLNKWIISRDIRVSRDIRKVGKLSDDNVSNIIKLNNLLSLSIEYDEITDIGVIAIANNLTNLQSLRLENCNSITDKSITAIAKSLTKLQELVIEGGYRSTDTGWVGTGEFITDSGLQALASGNLPNLQSLRMLFLIEITNAGIVSIANSSLSKLQLLNVSDCKRITRSGFVAEVGNSNLRSNLKILINGVDPYIVKKVNPQKEIDKLVQHLNGWAP